MLGPNPFIHAHDVFRYVDIMQIVMTAFGSFIDKVTTS